uniref:Pentatricopeptide repeat-containing protein n=1 Tax=Rhizophora mucronata TaxID=61149 RepID=A0A2P2IQE2_RHIMU
MHDYSDVTWATMILGCAQNGQPKDALEIFEEMRMQGVKPNYVTFICVLYACSQGGFVAEGWNYFSSMSCDHGISPGEDHYACMVDLLGHAGHIEEAEDLILNMPFQPGLLVWQTLLSACQLHGDIQTGKRAAELAMDLDGKDSKTYVLFSNMFSCLRNWEAVGMLRKAMKDRDVQKMPGSSWIELENAHW